jgi:hypothetical protein
LNKQSDNLSNTNESTLGGRNFTKQGNEIEEQPPTSSIQDRSNGIADQTFETPLSGTNPRHIETSFYNDDTLNANKIDINNNSDLSDSDEHSDISIDYDDDVRIQIGKLKNLKVLILMSMTLITMKLIMKK